MGTARPPKFVVPPGSVIITGAQGCSKAEHAAALAKHYGKTRVVDEWKHGDPVPADALVLTNDTRLINAIRFKNAMSAAGLVTSGGPA